MKPEIHPSYGPVVFRDRSAGSQLLTRSTIVAQLGDDAPTITWSDGSTYPVVDVQVSSASHPFWTGRSRTIDTEGRIEKFHRRYARPGGA
ncbi:type B 50S ribosomal protein L31 [Luteococcus sediminum]